MLNMSTIHKKYFYRVFEFVTTFGKDNGKSEGFDHSEDFFGDNLLECRKRAMEYYIKKELGFNNSSYHLPFASPKNFKFGENAAFSLRLSLVDQYLISNGETLIETEEEFPLYGEAEEEMIESREAEIDILMKLGHIHSADEYEKVIKI